MVVHFSNNGSHNSNDRVARRYRARRLEILSAAARTFRKQGVVNTGMREIAAAADLSAANLYHYFRGKQELVFFCQDLSLEAMLEALKQANRSRASLTEKVQSIIHAHTLCVLDEVRGSSAHVALDVLPQSLRARVIAKRDRYERGVRKLIEKGVATGEFVRCDPKLVTRAILGSLNWAGRWFDPEGPNSAAEVAEQFTGFLMRGLAAHQSSALERKRLQQ